MADFGNYGKPKREPALKGSFINGTWYCECKPALPALHMKTTKGPNEGKWYRSCQKKIKTDKSRCRFFIWDTEADEREKKALQSNSRTEPGRANPVTPSRPTPQRPASKVQAGPSIPNQKRSRAIFETDDEDEFGDVDVDFEEQLDQARVEAETPSKKARVEAPITPVRRKFPWDKLNATTPTTKTAGLQTPQTGPANPFISNPARDSSDITPFKIWQPVAESIQTMTPSSSPAIPSRFKDVESDLSRDVFGVLSGAGVVLGEQARRELTAVFSKQTTVAEGMKKGRDVARASMKAKDARVQELTHRVNTLEAELEAEKKTVDFLQYKLANGMESD
ncbi:hypothetical protein P280DRAFT_409126 [Massarina eburnea CBS 473.64]|uniref:GRF-type domain-containing protein n=1 Tax=Massarina eburnea CBS 473.64 TaxID=1395130 RepID=A0A6A6RM16_9PLEO|nr:hypothetical protein P280DRAFT_409126 [Massarina eburnea CBS 473.64]